MTVNLKLFMKSRDIQVAEEVGKKAELGYFDVEFTMYGCAYLDRTTNKLTFKVSDKAEDIYDFIEYAARDDIFPSAIETLTLKCPVPAGTKELIAKDIKKMLAVELNRKYTKEFFEELYQIADTVQDNYAAEFLWQEAELIEGQFDRELLDRHGELIDYCYSCRKLTKEEYKKLNDWINNERGNMDDDIVEKDIFEKTMYGIAYEEQGKISYIHNAQREYIYEMTYTLEQKGVCVTPILSKTYWYNYEYRLPDVIKDYKALMHRELNEKYCNKIKELKEGNRVISADEFQSIIEKARNNLGESCATTLSRYGYRWGILNKKPE